MKALLNILLCFLFLAPLQAAEIWLSPSGSDANPGTAALPKASLQAALRQARELRRLKDASIAGGIRIVLQSGRYELAETLLLTPEDSGSPTSPTTVEAADGATPVLDGGLSVTGWKPDRNHLWVANLPLVGGRKIRFRQVWVNGVKALSASSTKDTEMQRILAVDAKNKTIRIPWKGTPQALNTPGVELFLHQMWSSAVLRIASAQVQDGTALLRFHEPEASIEFDHPWPPPVISEKGNSPFMLRKALAFLDEPGEWYLDAATNKLYYWPREGESMSRADVRVPVLETLMTLEGTPERPLHHLCFKGLTFACTGWLRPSRMGDVPLQSGLFLVDAYKLPIPGTPDKATLENQAWVGRPSAAVTARYLHESCFEGCRFQQAGSSGLDLLEGCQSDSIRGCTFRDIAGNGLVVGQFSEGGQEAHLPFDPTDQRVLCRNLHVFGNLLEDVANEYWGCCGILAGFVRDVNVEHNELRQLSYTGISVGWGWTRTVNCLRNNRIHANRIHDFGRHQYSCGGIYTLSAQPGTVIDENCIYDVPVLPYAHDTTDYRIYLDEASSYMVVKDNWLDIPKMGFNQNGINLIQNNGPQVSDTIRRRAGLPTIIPEQP